VWGIRSCKKQRRQAKAGKGADVTRNAAVMVQISKNSSSVVLVTWYWLVDSINITYSLTAMETKKVLATIMVVKTFKIIAAHLFSCERKRKNIFKILFYFFFISHVTTA